MEFLRIKKASASKRPMLLYVEVQLTGKTNIGWDFSIPEFLLVSLSGDQPVFAMVRRPAFSSSYLNQLK